jgi:hypothetical protein
VTWAARIAAIRASARVTPMHGSSWRIRTIQSGFAILNAPQGRVSNPPLRVMPINAFHDSLNTYVCALSPRASLQEPMGRFETLPYNRS